MKKIIYSFLLLAALSLFSLPVFAESDLYIWPWYGSKNLSWAKADTYPFKIYFMSQTGLFTFYFWGSSKNAHITWQQDTMYFTNCYDVNYTTTFPTGGTQYIPIIDTTLTQQGCPDDDILSSCITKQANYSSSSASQDGTTVSYTDPDYATKYPAYKDGNGTVQPCPYMKPTEPAQTYGNNPWPGFGGDVLGYYGDNGYVPLSAISVTLTEFTEWSTWSYNNTLDTSSFYSLYFQMNYAPDSSNNTCDNGDKANDMQWARFSLEIDYDPPTALGVEILEMIVNCLKVVKSAVEGLKDLVEGNFYGAFLKGLSIYKDIDKLYDEGQNMQNDDSNENQMAAIVSAGWTSLMSSNVDNSDCNSTFRGYTTTGYQSDSDHNGEDGFVTWFVPTQDIYGRLTSNPVTATDADKKNVLIATVSIQHGTNISDGMGNYYMTAVGFMLSNPAEDYVLVNFQTYAGWLDNGNAPLSFAQNN